MVQILLKQGQVEVDTGDFTADYSDSLLLNRSVVEDLNNTIRVLTLFPFIADYAYYHFICWELVQYYSSLPGFRRAEDRHNGGVQRLS